MLDLSRPITTRAGAAVRVICTDSRARSGPLAVLLTDGVRELLRSYPLNGVAPVSYTGARQSAGSAWDLINARTKVKRWRVTYAADPALQRVPALYMTSVDALAHNVDPLGCLHPVVKAIELVDIYEDELPCDRGA
jgi:hypothetical protein